MKRYLFTFDNENVFLSGIYSIAQMVILLFMWYSLKAFHTPMYFTGFEVVIVHIDNSVFRY